MPNKDLGGAITKFYPGNFGGWRGAQPLVRPLIVRAPPGAADSSPPVCTGVQETFDKPDGALGPVLPWHIPTGGSNLVVENDMARVENPPSFTAVAIAMVDASYSSTTQTLTMQLGHVAPAVSGVLTEFEFILCSDNIDDPSGGNCNTVDVSCTNSNPPQILVSWWTNPDLIVFDAFTIFNDRVSDTEYWVAAIQDNTLQISRNGVVVVTTSSPNFHSGPHVGMGLSTENGTTGFTAADWFCVNA